jgi:hypothetical protein
MSYLRIPQERFRIALAQLLSEKILARIKNDRSDDYLTLEEVRR